MAEKEKPTITPEMLELMAHFAKELRKPDEETQAKLDAEKAKKIANAKSMAESAKYELEQKANFQRHCMHHNGNHPTFAGQLVPPGDVSVNCTRCQAEYRFNATAIAGQERDWQPSEAVKHFAPGQAEAWLEKLEKEYPPHIKPRRYIEFASK